MYLASLINKGREVFANGATDPMALPSEIVLKMATINGAKTALWDDEIGSIEAGKKVGLLFTKWNLVALLHVPSPCILQIYLSHMHMTYN